MALVFTSNATLLLRVGLFFSPHDNGVLAPLIPQAFKHEFQSEMFSERDLLSSYAERSACERSNVTADFTHVLYFFGEIATLESEDRKQQWWITGCAL